jgi:hypothetical protein
LVSTLVDEPQPSGTHSVVWQAQNFGSGVYFIRLQAGNVSRMKKCVLVK